MPTGSLIKSLFRKFKVTYMPIFIYLKATKHKIISLRRKKLAHSENGQKIGSVKIIFLLHLPVDSKLRSQIPSVLPYVWNAHRWSGNINL